MSKIAIVTDSTSDISCEDIEKYNIKIIPMRICFENKTYKDRFELNPLELYDMMKNEIPKSSLPSSEDISKVFEEVKSEGYSDILYIGVSSGLSGAYNFVKLMGENLKDINFHSFDTKSLSCGEGMLVMEAVRMAQANHDVNEILDKIKSIRKRTEAMFVVKDLTYLIKGGRIGKVAGTLGSLLKLCPIVRVNDDGVYETAAKSLGFPRSLQLMIKEFEKRFKGRNIKVSVVHGLEENTANAVMNKIKQFANVIEEAIVPVTAVLAVHTGPGLVGIIAHDI